MSKDLNFIDELNLAATLGRVRADNGDNLCLVTILRIEKAARMIAEMRDALKPFAEALAHEDMDFPDDTPVVGLLTGSRITLGDCRFARRAIKELTA